MKISKELVLLYFNNQCSVSQERQVVQWLAASVENTKQAMRWIDELTDEEEKLFLKMVLSSKDVWKETMSQIEENKPIEAKRSGKPGKIRILISNWLHHTYRNAALLAGVLMLIFAYYVYQKSRFADISTKMGEVKEHTLPDGSEIRLGSNSHVRYYYHQRNGERKLWLSGTARFHIKTVGNQPGFQLYLSGYDHIEAREAKIEVTETGPKCRISLLSGAAQLLTARRGKMERIDLKLHQPVEMERL
ncbi:hypothetical protein DYBT9275_01436 [Dyadobacter sp. CECT 9275]|uniref:FecR protein domain-containing protein n=1 Tax=Dyadobacter helix TaxID=2822344 RepID=A0A916N3E3_9BACT|nr:FecR family protein [Dyadobacter sp. CECT 9275]CAG4994642.1 hypothetical protein DYBT9275_01436 [Dyadobacter sp. CECT 9275]